MSADQRHSVGVIATAIVVAVLVLSWSLSSGDDVVLVAGLLGAGGILLAVLWSMGVR